VAVGTSPGRNCSFYGSWRDQLEMPFRHVIGPPSVTNWSYNARFTDSQPRPNPDLFTCGVLTRPLRLATGGKRSVPICTACLLSPQKRTFVAATGMSALCQKRTCRTAERAPLFNHFVGGGEQYLWDRQRKRPGGLKIDDEFEFGWLLNGKLGGLCTFQD